VSFLNHYSFALAGAVLLLGVGYALLQTSVVPWKVAVLAALTAALVAISLTLRTAPSAPDSPAAVEATLRSGQPTVVEFYSNF